MIRCLIIDDEPFARSLLADYINKVPYLDLIGEYSTAIDAIEHINSKEIDLLFLDIQMPELTGVEFLKVIEHKPQVIFTTAFSEYALEGYELNVIDYLLKPFDFARFLKGCEKVKKALQPKLETKVESKDYIFLKDGNSLQKQYFRDIYYIKGLKDYVRVLAKSKEHIVLYTFKELLNELPERHFIRIHNSYIVNVDHISAIEKNRVLINDQYIPIGRTFREEMNRILE
ncbi:response regulator [Mangrovivirga sp. M17]|uniref:Response regulator n=1 Tax=Mangrovivirga halotolerans TaxID=2993936 RepID=A0ABT3RU72_9BACT|nr:response regulator [Mangrovivirga halotolerans]MCX2745331.1 response regulator [Mangrovivirga halotolerans]